MRSGLFGLVVAAAALFAPLGEVSAQVDVTGNVSLTSDYAFRGISQTLAEPAVQGGLDVALPYGLYAGAWGSSVNFGEIDMTLGERAQMELDLYAGIAPSVGGFDLDLGALYYLYPGAGSSRGYDFLEIYGGVGRDLGLFSIGLNGAYSPDFFGNSGTGLFGSLSASAGVPGLPVSVEGSLGRQTIEDEAAFGAPDYNLWSIGASTDVLGASLGAAVTGTNLNENECFGGSDVCKARLILSVSRAL